MLVRASSTKTHVGNSVVGDVGVRYRDKLMAILHPKVEKDCSFIINMASGQVSSIWTYFSISPHSVAW